VTTPWIDKKYLDIVNSMVKFYIPFAYPSQHLKKMFKHKFFGFVYRLFHAVAKKRVERGYFKFPIDWIIIKFLYYNFRVKYRFFPEAKTPR